MKRTQAVAWIAAVGLALGCLWYFGRQQPIEVVERQVPVQGTAACTACSGRKIVACAACGGEGRLAAGSVPCPQCGGSGKCVPQLRGSSSIKRLGIDPPCPKCGGAGQWTNMGNCPECGGGRWAQCPMCDGTGATRQGGTQTVRTVRAGHSLWERVLSWIFIAPDGDCAPFTDADGRVPLVDAYLPLFAKPGVSGRVVKWSGIRRGSEGWEVRTVLRVRRGDSESDQDRVFVVRNREVVSAGPAARSP